MSNSARITEGNARILAAVRTALEDKVRPRTDWRLAIKDAITELEIAKERASHPDTAGRINSALSCLAGVWYSDDAIDDIYDGGEGA